MDHSLLSSPQKVVLLLFLKEQLFCGQPINIQTRKVPEHNCKAHVKPDACLILYGIQV